MVRNAAGRAWFARPYMRTEWVPPIQIRSGEICRCGWRRRINAKRPLSFLFCIPILHRKIKNAGSMVSWYLFETSYLFTRSRAAPPAPVFRSSSQSQMRPVCCRRGC